jgi:hypothetical protein
VTYTADTQRLARSGIGLVELEGHDIDANISVITSIHRVNADPLTILLRAGEGSDSGQPR